MKTLKAAVWRFFVAVCDYRTLIRKLLGKPVVDAVFITNMRDRTDRDRYLGLWNPKCGHFNGPRYWINGIVGRTRALDITTEDLATHEGRKKAKDLIVSATNWAKNNGAKVILLAASLKQIFGNNGTKLKELFPDLVFTIGDNGTFYLLKEETLNALKEANLTPIHSRIAIIGPYGILGEMMTSVLKEAGYNIIGVGHRLQALNKIAKKYEIEVFQTYDEIGKVDAIVACTHSTKVSLCATNVSENNPNSIRRTGRKLLVIDVAEPSNFKRREWLKCKDLVVRQDAGNAFSPKLKYVLGPVSYRMFRLSKGITFGCFAEALALSENIIKNNGELVNINHFDIKEDNIENASKLFKKTGFTVQSPRSHGKMVKSFELDIPETSKQESHIFLKEEEEIHLQDAIRCDHKN